MVSLLSMVANTITSVFTYALKAFFSLLFWFLKTLVKIGKFIHIILPLTSIVLVILFVINIFILFTSNAANSPVPDISAISDISEDSIVIDAPTSVKGADELLDKNTHVTIAMFSGLKTWWMNSVHIYSGSGAYILLLILTVLMFIPVMTVFLLICVFLSFGNVLFLSVIADIVVYIVRAVFGKNFLDQATDRYCRLFPSARVRHAEKDYEKWLKKKTRQLQDEEKYYKNNKAASFYEEDDQVYDRDDYYEDEYDDDAEFEEEYSDDDYDEIDEYDDEEDYYEDYSDEEEEEYDDPRIGQKKSSSAASSATSGFDFFAGCQSRESVDKKYKSLVKLYHPDNMDGDTKALQEINVQYEKAKKRWR